MIARELRKRVKAALAPRDVGGRDALSLEELGHLLHELDVHQVELELQNDELRRSQIELETARQLQQAELLAAVATLASGVAHDFNNLLMGIGGCARLALGGLPEGSPARRFIEEISGATERGAGVVRQLQSFSREQSDRSELLSLDDALAAQFGLLERTLPEDIRLRLAPAAGGGRVRLPVGQLEQLILNLSINARDAMPHGGQLSIATEQVELQQPRGVDPVLEPGPYLRITVTDTGQGMDAPTLSRIFEPFFTTKGPDSGTGLGLASAHGIVRRAGGLIEVDSTPGEGTRFEILLPAASVVSIAPPPRQAARTPAQDQPERTLLLVEDDRIVRMTLSEELQQAGFRVLTASTAMVALERAAKLSEHLDLLLTDVVLPGMDGTELARELRIKRPDLATIYISAHDRDYLIDTRGMSADARVLRKPFRVEQVLAAVRETLG